MCGNSGLNSFLCCSLFGKDLGNSPFRPLLVGGVTVLFLKRKLFIRLIVPLIFLIIAVLNSFYTLNNIKTAESLPLEKTSFKGVVTEAPKIYESGQAITVKSREINGKIWVFSNAIYDIKAGDTVTLDVDLQNLKVSKDRSFRF